MVEKGLIKKTNFDEGSMDYTITTEGYEILTIEGGWLKHLEGELLRHVEEKVEVNEEKQTERNRFLITILVAIAIAIGSSIVDIFQSKSTGILELEQARQSKKNDSLSIMLNAHHKLLITKDKQIQELNIRIDSIQIEHKPKMK
jgi:hypothetical protein